MAGRISTRLAAWVRMPERQLKDDLAALGENPLDRDLIARARTLFAKVLDAPGGGIRIQTIHGFAQSLLSAFPIEAGLRSEEHTSELQSLMRISYAVFCLKKKKNTNT